MQLIAYLIFTILRLRENFIARQERAAQPQQAIMLIRAIRYMFLLHQDLPEHIARLCIRYRATNGESAGAHIMMQ